MELTDLVKQSSVGKIHDFNGENTLISVGDHDFEANTQSLHTELGWLEKIIALRMEGLNAEMENVTSDNGVVPASEQETGIYGHFVQEHDLNEVDRLLLILCFAAQYSPQILDAFLKKRSDNTGVLREIGGVYSRENGQFIPTLQTALFLLSGGNQAKVASYYHYFQNNHFLFREQIITLESISQNYDYLAGYMLKLEKSYFDYFLIGKRPRLDGTSNFPATLLETDKKFEDLILPDTTRDQLKSLMDFIRFRKELFNESDVVGKIKPGFTTLLYGRPGTGKTMTVSVIGKHLGVDVYIVNLSRVVSKYIGETEKNLEKIFERLEGKDCILFFDEADALFGKRTEVKDAKDRYANQEVAYLLQRIEKCSCPVILASNYKQNLDDAFKRRILTFIHIPPPESHERLQMWQTGLPSSFQYEPVNLPEKLATDYPLTGANISNVIKLGCIHAMSEGTKQITLGHLEGYIQQEMRKENMNVKPMVNTAASRMGSRPGTKTSMRPR
ncbi:ATP-binding protein [Fulvivirga sp. 29W222]|uniref:ATP-binding protein n=1 Tax=Fulvivirga marina TaxID=2494733 RepID=A0A937FUE1_9BACT|nr:ATP-binding protein [Fulvivirga marina]MBL6445153.1 ATP-binding protein [Fulvivirga marina]